VSRSRGHKSRKSKWTVKVQTHVTPEVARMLEQRIEGDGSSQAAYVRRLIHKDLGLTEDSNG
jgi:hypothetical protein